VAAFARRKAGGAVGASVHRVCAGVVSSGNIGARRATREPLQIQIISFIQCRPRIDGVGSDE
jgi:hypothetical protein